MAAMCRKYRDVRLECAVAANIETCIEIKMDAVDPVFVDAVYHDRCNAPASPDTPNALECFFLNFSR